MPSSARSAGYRTANVSQASRTMPSPALPTSELVQCLWCLQDSAAAVAWVLTHVVRPQDRLHLLHIAPDKQVRRAGLGRRRRRRCRSMQRPHPTAKHLSTMVPATATSVATGYLQ